MHACTHVSRRLVLLAVFLVLCIGSVWGVASALASSPSAAPASPLILKVGWSPDPDSLNPFVGVQQSSYELWHISYDFLTDYGDKYLETRPGLAESWTKSPTGSPGPSRSAAASSGATGSR